MDEEKFKLHIDTKGYKEKPKKKAGEIKPRLQKSSTIVEVSLKELIEAVEEGKTISPAVMKGTKAEDFIEQQVYMVDIDNNNKKKHILQVEEAISICEKNCLPLAFYYFSFSHTEEIPKFRLVFVMNEVITDSDLRLMIIQNLIALFEQADTSCTNADRIFFGTNKEAVICDLKARITIDNVLEISPKSIIEKKEKLDSSIAESELDKLINDFDFFGYLKERNGAVKYDTSKYAMFENCEICGHHNDLVYYKDTNTFYCHSSSGKKGGSIIDYLMAVEHITLKEAIKKFKKELCKMSKKLELICMDDIEIEEVKWLWYPYIPAGKITILQGDPR